MRFIKSLLSDIEGVVIFIIGAIITGIIAIFVVIALDQLGTDHHEKVKIVGQTFDPAHVVMITVSNGKTTTIMPQYIPDEWGFIVEWDNAQYECSSNLYWYGKQLNNELSVYADVIFTTGLITRSEYCSGIQPRSLNEL